MCALRALLIQCEIVYFWHNVVVLFFRALRYTSALCWSLSFIRFCLFRDSWYLLDCLQQGYRCSAVHVNENKAQHSTTTLLTDSCEFKIKLKSMLLYNHFSATWVCMCVCMCMSVQYMLCWAVGCNKNTASFTMALEPATFTHSFHTNFFFFFFVRTSTFLHNQFLPCHGIEIDFRISEPISNAFDIS